MQRKAVSQLKDSVKTIVIFTPSRWTNECWLPALWCQAKTYYEKHGKQTEQWRWYPCFADTAGDDIDQIKDIITKAQPDIFAVSLYTWNAELGLSVAEWVKNQWPRCVVISGGPHQHFKYDISWFKKHAYLDASLPGDCYGELFIAEVLDNYQDGTVDWQQCTEVRFPTPHRNGIIASPKKLGRAEKRQFDYQWAAFAEQAKHIHEYMDYASSAKFLAILETTRGCPYGCTYCDWGGGISTSIIKKDVQVVVKDIEFLGQLNLWHLYVADANFGIFEDRDIAIAEKLADTKTRYQQQFLVGYGGFAKTANRMDAIKHIVEIGLEYGMFHSDAVKISLQSLDREVLQAINRQNIDLSTQIESFRSLPIWSDKFAFVELIIGLPMMTLDKFYSELDQIGRLDLKKVYWYEWMLLPETPAYDPQYINKHGLQILRRNHGWKWQEDMQIDIVISSNTYSTDDYMAMLLSTSAWDVFMCGGLFAKSIHWVMQNHKIEWGQLIRDWFESAVDQQALLKQWHAILADPNRACHFNINGQEVFGGKYLLGQLCYDKDCQYHLAAWLSESFGCPDKILDLDLKQHRQDLDYEILLNDSLLYQRPGSLLRQEPTWWQDILDKYIYDYHNRIRKSQNKRNLV